MLKGNLNTFFKYGFCWNNKSAHLSKQRSSCPHPDQDVIKDAKGQEELSTIRPVASLQASAADVACTN
jgi:hypothetical protein